MDQSLIVELEAAIESGSNDRRVNTLRRITDLFVASAERFNERQIELFDDVIGHLIKRIEKRTLAELARRLAPVAAAPPEVIRSLAADDDIAVAEPVLAQSARLTDADLIALAETKSEAHMLAISTRPHIGAAVTDALLQRGDEAVFHKLANNPGADFSEGGFTALLDRAENDERLAETVGLRLDLPIHLFQELLARATADVRARLLNYFPPGSREGVQAVIAAIAEDVDRKARLAHQDDYTRARARVMALQGQGKLGEEALLDFAKADGYAEIVAALSLLSGAPLDLMERLLENQYLEAFLIPCKAAGLEWPTTALILTCRTVGRCAGADDLKQARADYARLSKNSAQRVLRFWQLRQSAGTDPARAA